jgi:hypothetical protein
MSTSIDTPPFPKLTLATWNDRGGELNGNAVFPHWAALQSTAAANLCDDAGDGSFYVTVNSPAGAHDRPSPEQVAALRHLIDNAGDVFSAVLQSIYDEYHWMREDFAECLTPDEAVRLVPDLSVPIELLPLLSFGTMTVHRVFNADLAYIGLSFGCTWDEEHGLGVLIHGSRVVSVGGCDTSFMEWIPQSDARGDA